MQLTPQRHNRLFRAALAVIEDLEQRQLLSAALFQTGTASVAPTASPVAIAAGWVIGDGNIDLVTANGSANTVSILRGNGDGTFQPAETIGVGNDPVAVAIGQFGGSAYYSIVTANKGDDTVSVLTNDGQGEFSLTQTLTTGDGPDAVAIGDFANNGYSDIAVANSGDDTVSIFMGQPGGGFAPAKTYSVGGDPDSIAIGDLGNVELDIVTANAADGTVSVLFGNGDGTFQPAETFAVGNDPTSVALGTFNNYGLTDIVTANAGDNTVSILHNDGLGGFGPAQTYSVGSDPVSVAVGDFTGDGLDDIVTANAADDTVTVLLGQPGGGFSAAQTYSTGHAPAGLAVADVNNDGYADIVAANSGDGTVTVLTSVPQYYSVSYSGSGPTIYTPTVTGIGTPVFASSGQSPQSTLPTAAVNFETEYGKPATGAADNNAPIAGDLSLLGSQVDPFASTTANAEDSLQTNLPFDDQSLSWSTPDNLALFSADDYAGADSPADAVAVNSATPALAASPAKDLAANPVVVAANPTANPAFAPAQALAMSPAKVNSIELMTLSPNAKTFAPNVHKIPTAAPAGSDRLTRLALGSAIMLATISQSPREDSPRVIRRRKVKRSA
jgi:hypothetical protein